jgi:serine/threonine-protein kinase
VYQARDAVLDREVAVKVLSQETTTAVTIKRFSLEMRVTAKLEHSNILHLYDSGRWNDRLFYVMELVRGPTLATRLRTEGALAIEDALSIARDIGGALAFAHRNHIVHRDVKPENILLAHRGALLADFGVANVLGEAGHQAITSTGVAVGTTTYMSPEQLFAERIVDARSDQYALALICYEMLTGVKPHVAASVDALRSLRVGGVTTPITAHRPSVPAEVDKAIIRALAPSPADRFRDIDEFMEELDIELLHGSTAPGVTAGAIRGVAGGSSRGTRERTDASRRRTHDANRWDLLKVASLVAVAIVVVSGVTIAFARARSGGMRGGDAGALAIGLLQPARAADSIFAERVYQELDSWQDVAVTRERVTSASQPTIADLKSVANRSGVEIVLAPSVAVMGDSTKWTLTVYGRDVAHSRRLTFTGLGPLSTVALRGLATRAIVGPAADSSRGIEGLHHPSLAAATSFVQAWSLLHAGAIDSARKAFASAVSADPSFAQAQFWLAQTGAWQAVKHIESWRDAARNALAIPNGLSGTDSVLAQALVALSSDPPAACGLYQTAIEQAPTSFTAWYGLGQCRQVDSIVIRDPRAEGGVRFRSSHWGALAAYRRALEYVPTPAMSVLMNRPPVVDLTYAASNRARRGVGQRPDTNSYVALPSLSGDSIALIPVPLAVISTSGVTPRTFSAALRRGRQALLDFTNAWTIRAPSSRDAWFNRAYALELTGSFDAPDPINSATKALERAATLTTDREQVARVDVSRVRVAVRRGEFEEAKRLARAALSRAAPASTTVAAIQAPLAAFLGDVDKTNELLRLAATSTNASDRHRLPPWVANTLTSWLADSLRAFGVRAIIGVCDGLEVRRDALEKDLRVHIAPAELAARRDTLLRDVYRQATPCLGTTALRGFTATNPVEAAIAALDAGDRVRALETLRALDRKRAGVASGSVSEDAVLIEAWVWRRAGDTSRAQATIDANIRDIASIGGYTFDEVAQAAAVLRLHSQVSKKE